MKHVSKSHLEQAILFRFLEEANGEGRPKAVHEVPTMFSVPVPGHRVNLALEALYNDDCLKKQITGNGWELYSISNDGLANVEGKLAQGGSFLEQYAARGDSWLFGGAPASDRVVLFSDNQPEFQEIRDGLNALVSQLANSNDVGDLTVDEVLEAQREVWLLQQAFDADRVRVDWVEALATKALKWIGEKAAGAAVGKAALSIFATITSLVGRSF